jgi:mono/diheme cytochrome c family protein
LWVSAFAQEPSQAVTSGQIKAGAELYATNCSPCHGVRLDGTEMAFDLRKFPPGQRERSAGGKASRSLGRR